MEELKTLPGNHESAIQALRDLERSERLLALYAYGIEGCADHNAEQVTAVLRELISLLNFDCGEVAHGFYRLYTFCLARTLEAKLDQVAFILGDLHDTFSRAFDQSRDPELEPAVRHA